MQKDNNMLVTKKRLITENLSVTFRNIKLFKQLDALFLKKAFINTSDLSTNENLLTLQTKKLTINEICNLLDNFIKPHNLNYIQKKRQLYELIKISNLPQHKLVNIFTSSKCSLLEKRLISISKETSVMSFDFLILQIINNLQLKIKDCVTQKNFASLTKKILSKLVTFEYQTENKEKTSTFLCWIDILLNFVNLNLLSLQDFTLINKKILAVTTPNIELYWKMLAAVNFLLKQQLFCCSDYLREFKRFLSKTIEQKKITSKNTRNDVINITINMLTKPTISKEDYYFLFDNIAFLSQNNDEDKLFCLYILQYLFYQNKRSNLFVYRFGREYFLKTLFNILSITDREDVKIEEFVLFVNILLNKNAFELHINDVFEKMLTLLKSINDDADNITSQLFYKFCDAVDYFSSQYDVSQFKQIPAFLANKKRPYSAICKHFQLNSFKYSV